jgi:hypothetical protein
MIHDQPQGNVVVNPGKSEGEIPVLPSELSMGYALERGKSSWGYRLRANSSWTVVQPF